MKLDYQIYKLITERESQELFSLQSHILSCDILSEPERALKLSLLMVQNPICDYETAITILNDISSPDLKVLLVGAEMDAVWPFIQPNPFIARLKGFYPNCSDPEKSVIKYLEAIDVENRFGAHHNFQTQIKQLLKESVELCDKYVNNYYRLSLLLDYS